MRRIREILRLRFEQQMSWERIAGALGVAKGTVRNTLARFETSGLGWPLPGELGDEQLESRLYPQAQASAEQQAPGAVAQPDIDYIERELRRPHVTLELLWREYREQWPQSKSRSWFYRYVAERLPAGVTMVTEHKGGDRVFVDFSGDGLEYIEPARGQMVKVALFVACWGASSYTFAVASMGQDTASMENPQPSQICLNHPNGGRTAVHEVTAWRTSTQGLDAHAARACEEIQPSTG